MKTSAALSDTIEIYAALCGIDSDEMLELLASGVGADIFADADLDFDTATAFGQASAGRLFDYEACSVAVGASSLDEVNQASSQWESGTSSWAVAA